MGVENLYSDFKDAALFDYWPIYVSLCQGRRAYQM